MTCTNFLRLKVFPRDTMPPKFRRILMFELEATPQCAYRTSLKIRFKKEKRRFKRFLPINEGELLKLGKNRLNRQRMESVNIIKA